VCINWTAKCFFSLSLRVYQNHTCVYFPVIEQGKMQSSSWMCIFRLCFSVLGTALVLRIPYLLRPQNVWQIMIYTKLRLSLSRKLSFVLLSDLLWNFSLTIISIAVWPWGWLSLYQKWVPGEFPGGKCVRCLRLTTLPPSCAVVMKSGNLNFLEHSGPLQACNGTALAFYFYQIGSVSVTLCFSSRRCYI